MDAKATKRAYLVWDANDDDAGQMIVFARTARLARLYGHGTGCLTDTQYIDARAKRAPEFDDASDPPTPREWIDRGYYHWCCGCVDVKISIEDIDDPGDGDKPVFDTTGKVYHSRDCFNQYVQSCKRYNWPMAVLDEAAA